MSIKSIRWKKWLVVAAVLGMIAAGLYVYFNFDNFSESGRRRQARFAEYRKSEGVKRDLAVGKIRPGDTVESLKANYPNLTYETVESWTLIREHGVTESGFSLTAKDGKLVTAISCSCIYYDVFFDARSKREIDEFSAAMERWQFRMMCDRRDQSTLNVALAGAAANIIFHKDGAFFFPYLDNPPRD